MRRLLASLTPLAAAATAILSLVVVVVASYFLIETNRARNTILDLIRAETMAATLVVEDIRADAKATAIEEFKKELRSQLRIEVREALSSIPRPEFEQLLDDEARRLRRKTDSVMSILNLHLARAEEYWNAFPCKNCGAIQHRAETAPPPVPPHKPAPRSRRTR